MSNSYYTNLHNYQFLQNIRNTIMNTTEPDTIIIQDLQKNHIDSNSYILYKDGKTWMPLVHLAMCFNRPELVKYLLKDGANVCKLADTTDPCLSIYFICNQLYLKYLVQKGCPFPEIISETIVKQLTSGAVKRLQHLEKLGLLTKAHYQTLLTDNDIPLKLVTTLVNYLFYAFNIKKHVTNKTDDMEKNIALMKESLQFIVDKGAPISHEFLKYCCEHYLWEYLLIYKSNLTPQLIPVYHMEMDGKVVALLRPLLNDKRYENLCQVLSVKPVAELYTSYF